MRQLRQVLASARAGLSTVGAGVVYVCQSKRTNEVRISYTGGESDTDDLQQKAELQFVISQAEENNSGIGKLHFVHNPAYIQIHTKQPH